MIKQFFQLRYQAICCGCNGKMFKPEFISYHFRIGIFIFFKARENCRKSNLVPAFAGLPCCGTYIHNGSNHGRAIQAATQAGPNGYITSKPSFNGPVKKMTELL